ncbi:unnamed protein product [Victoria cruziana]
MPQKPPFRFSYSLSRFPIYLYPPVSSSPIPFSFLHRLPPFRSSPFPSIASGPARFSASRTGVGFSAPGSCHGMIELLNRGAWTSAR